MMISHETTCTFTVATVLNPGSNAIALSDAIELRISGGIAA